MRPTLRYSVCLLLIILAFSLVFPLIFRGPYPHPAGPAFDKAVSKLYLRAIEEQYPGIVLLGDSMLTKGVDQSNFEREVGARTYKLDIPGSSSALWYLVLESNILPAQPAPRTVVILFRDTLLTAPAFRTTGPYFGLIDKFARPQDTLVLERAYLSQLAPAQIWLEKYLPLYTYRGEVRESVDGGLRHWLPGALGCDRACADEAMTHVLGDIQPELLTRSIIQAEQVIYTPQQLDFPAQLPGSFLPEILRMAKEHGVQLIFVRAPTNLFPNPASEPAGLEQYMVELRGYLAREGAVLLDLSHVAGITPAQFVDPHHLTLEGKGIFTKALAAALKGLLK
jgi:hypothetical protein